MLCLLSLSLQTNLFVPGNKRRVLLTLLVYYSIISFTSRYGMKFFVLSIPETDRQQPSEVNKDVLKTSLYKWRNRGKGLICLRPGQDIGR